VKENPSSLHIFVDYTSELHNLTLTSVHSLPHMHSPLDPRPPAVNTTVATVHIPNNTMKITSVSSFHFRGIVKILIEEYVLGGKLMPMERYKLFLKGRTTVGYSSSFFTCSMIDQFSERRYEQNVWILWRWMFKDTFQTPSSTHTTIRLPNC